MEGSSIRGKYFSDKVALGRAFKGNEASRAVLGCHTVETNLFVRQKPSGIMGLSMQNWDFVEVRRQSSFLHASVESCREQRPKAVEAARSIELPGKHSS